MKRSAFSCFIAMLAIVTLLPDFAQAKPKKEIYNNTPEQVFLAAVRTARERHVVTGVELPTEQSDDLHGLPER